MAFVIITFDFSDESTDACDFEVDSGVLSSIEDYGACAAEDLNAERDEDDEVEIECEGWEVSSTNLDYDSQADHDEFGSLDDWGEYCEEVDKYGEAYCLRYADVGEFDFDDEYQGEWGSEEEFVENLVEDCYDIKVPSFVYVDWERTARDVMMDYSSYDTNSGFYIFRA